MMERVVVVSPIALDALTVIVVAGEYSLRLDPVRAPFVEENSIPLGRLPEVMEYVNSSPMQEGITLILPPMVKI